MLRAEGVVFPDLNVSMFQLSGPVAKTFGRWAAGGSKALPLKTLVLISATVDRYPCAGTKIESAETGSPSS